MKKISTKDLNLAISLAKGTTTIAEVARIWGIGVGSARSRMFTALLIAIKKGLI